MSYGVARVREDRTRVRRRVVAYVFKAADLEVHSGVEGRDRSGTHSRL